MKAWTGRALVVDLTRGSVRSRPLDPDISRAFLGGRGLGSRLLWDLVGPDVAPLSPENVLIFATGPLTATGVQTSNRFSVTTKSPLTGTILDANSGGYWGMRFKRTGYDALIVQGRAKTPVYLELVSGSTRINDARSLWGFTVSQTTEHLGQGKQRSVLCIGPAGENLVHMAAIMNDGSRSLARGGPGAVMGSKNLKAIVVQGDEGVRIEDKEGFKFVVYEAGKHLKANPLTSQALPEFGTAIIMNVVNSIGALPTRNFQASQFEDAEAISGETLTGTLLVKKAACWACPIACTRVTRTARNEGEGPEYETIWAFGAQCGINDLVAIAEANYLCNDLGLDTISVGSTIGCAMELAERGHLPSTLRFGRVDLLHQTIEDIAYRRDLGDELADGSRCFATKYGAPELSMSVKGLELPGYDPRGMQGQGLLYATSNRGGCHMRGNMLGPEVLGLPRLVDRFAVQGKAGIVAVHQNLAAVIDSLVLCKFSNLAVSEEYYARALSAVTGHSYTVTDLLQIGERIWNLERLYNLREGFTRASDTLPRRLLEEPVPQGPSQGQVVQLEPMLDEYYQFRGWDEDGVLTCRKLEELGLAALVEDKRMGGLNDR